MRKIQTEVDRSFPDLGFQVAGFLQDDAHGWEELSLDLLRTQVPEVSWQGLLNELKYHEVVLQDWVFDAFFGQLEEYLKTDFWGLVVSVDLTVHGVASLGIKIVKLLFNLLDGGLPCRPCLGEEASHNLKAKNFKEWLGLFFQSVT
jgi:hypothetical protein